MPSFGTPKKNSPYIARKLAWSTELSDFAMSTTACLTAKPPRL
jgi:hypothetical protein